MSYNCDIEMKADKKTLELIEKELSVLKESQIEIMDNELVADFREDCSETIFNLAKKEGLTLSYLYNGEYEDLDKPIFIEFKDGEEV